MDGELAALFRGGNQVGGLFDWELNTFFEPSVKNGWYEYKIVRLITAQSYWFDVAPDGYCFEIRLYKAIRGQLVLIGEGKLEIDLVDQTLGHRLYAPIKIRWV